MEEKEQCLETRRWILTFDLVSALYKGLETVIYYSKGCIQVSLLQLSWNYTGEN